jgi:hypothetical protein
MPVVSGHGYSLVNILDDFIATEPLGNRFVAPEKRYCQFDIVFPQMIDKSNGITDFPGSLSQAAFPEDTKKSYAVEQFFSSQRATELGYILKQVGEAEYPVGSGIEGLQELMQNVIGESLLSLLEGVEKNSGCVRISLTEQFMREELLDLGGKNIPIAPAYVL